MDFSKFRASGDLSDITVIVEGHENKLHKFPLYARSDYFCQLTRSHPAGEPEINRVNIPDFPGGNEVFEQVADFCYNMPINITKQNAVAIRCATEYLKMGGSGNLMEQADKFISDSISTSKANGSTVGPVAMLMDCNAFGDIALKTGIVTICINTIIECWAKLSAPKIGHMGSKSVFSKVALRSKAGDGDTSSAFTKVGFQNQIHPSVVQTDGKLDEVSINCLLSIRPDWFASFLTSAKEKGINLPELGHLAVRYVSETMNRNSLARAKAANNPNLEENEDNSEKEADEAEEDDNNDNTPDNSPQMLNIPLQLSDIKDNLDLVISTLPEHAYNIPAVTIEWITKVRFCIDCQTIKPFLKSVKPELFIVT